ncbi:MAG: trypsin-like peptidase domain-containing protein [Nocardioidaceae bacterium]
MGRSVRHTLRRAGAAAAGLALLVMGLPAPAQAEDANPRTILAAKAYPGIQLIATTYTATVTVAIPTVNQTALNSLVNRLILQAATGVIGTSDAEISEAIVAAIVKSPGRYFVATSQTYSDTASVIGVGTGWVITPDGYIVTAAHVVEADPAELAPEFAAKTLTKVSNAFVKGLSSGTTSFNRGQVNRLANAVTKWFAGHMSVSDLRTDVAALVAQGSVSQGKKQEAVSAQVVDAGVPYPGNDVALLKIDGVDNMPTLELGEDGDVAEGSTLHVAGYPAASTFSGGLSAASRVQPTVTEGPITAIKYTADDMPVFQTQAPASPGNSGGPVLDDEAKVVGVLVASAVGSDGVALEGQEFVIPVSVVQEMLDANGVQAEPSETSTSYDEAIDDFYQAHYKDALPLFQKAQELYPDHPYVDQYIDDTNAGIANGDDKSPVTESKSDSGGGLPGWLIPVAGGVAGLLVVLLLLMVVLRKRGSGKTPAAGAAQQPQQPYPGYAQQGGYPQQTQQPAAPQAPPPTAPYPQQPQQAYPQQAQQGYPQQQAPAAPGYPQQPQQAYPQQPAQPQGYPQQPQQGYQQQAYPDQGQAYAQPQQAYPPQAPVAPQAPAAPQPGYAAPEAPPAAPPPAAPEPPAYGAPEPPPYEAQTPPAEGQAPPPPPPPAPPAG